MRHIRLILGLALGVASLWLATPVEAATNQINFDSFTGIYHLSRDSRGLSLLTTEETIVADFPASGFTGITRQLPKSFQNHSVNIKILNVRDAAGDPVPYKTSTDTSGDLVVTTGDPAITLSGPQTIKLTYQTTGVINLSTKLDEFLLNVNGRGWGQPFNMVDATLYIPASFQARLQGKPSCYTSLNSQNAAYCQISAQQTADSTVVTARSRPVPAHQALVMKLDFAPDTFTNKHASLLKPIILIILGAISVLVAVGQIYNVFWPDKSTKM